MNFQIDKSKGWTEAIIDKSCEFSKFEKVALLMKSNLSIVFTQQLKDIDNTYFDFVYNSSTLCLHYNIYLGISIFPTRFQNASKTDNDNVIKVTNALITLL